MQYSVVYLRDQEPISSRLDAEYYRPAYLQAESLLKSQKWDYLENLSISIKSFGAYSLTNQIEYKNKGIPFLRGKDIKAGMIDFSDVLFIDDEANKLLWKSEVKPETVLFTMSGTVGNSAIATQELAYPINSNQDIAKITTNKKLNPYYFSIFLQSKHGELQISRLPIGSVQQHIFLWQLEKMIVPLFSMKFQNDIEKIFKLSLQTKHDADTVFEEGKSLLLSELGLANWQPKHRLSFVRNSSEVEKAERIDAEYFQPKYDEIVSAIKNYAGGWDYLGNLVTAKKSVEIGSSEYLDAGIPFIRVSNLSPFELSEEKYMSEKLYAELVKHQPQRGEILLSKDGSPGIAYHLHEKPEKMIVSGGILRLKLKDKRINADYLTLVLNSLLVQEQASRDIGGSIIYHWRPDQVKEVVIPILETEKQLEIQQKVSESFALRAKSKSLLEAAKRAVEMAIEEGEEKALAWLEAETRLVQS